MFKHNIALFHTLYSLHVVNFFHTVYVAGYRLRTSRDQLHRKSPYGDVNSGGEGDGGSVEGQ